MASSRLKELYQRGQSPWYDNIDRRLIVSGELKSFFDRGIVGVTSNPTIFEKAITGSSVYDEKIASLKAQGADLAEICDTLTADDVRDAADLLAEAYNRTQGVDGWVSIEVLPAYAHDPEKTLVYARHIFKKVDRPNVMIKVPGTPESSAAIATLIAEGISVNVTLLFSVEHYLRAARAYLEGLDRRSHTGEDLGAVASVASVFISRIDSKVDYLLESFSARETVVEKRAAIDALKGKIAVANAKMIYRVFKDMFGEAKFGPLKMLGARPQRPLWASTSTKNPAYSDCMYVDNLIGSMTVNTIPHGTVLAFEDHGRLEASLETDLKEARVCLAALPDLTIDLDEICEDAQKDGVQAFVKSWDTLMGSIEAKIKSS